jgi:hypothetical protein
MQHRVFEVGQAGLQGGVQHRTIHRRDLEYRQQLADRQLSLPGADGLARQVVDRGDRRGAEAALDLSRVNP